MKSKIFLILVTYWCAEVFCNHDSLNYILPTRGRQCFFEDFAEGSNSKQIEIFIPSGGNVDIFLEIFGPLSLSELRKEEFTSPLQTYTISATEEEESGTHSFTQEFDPEIPGTYALCTDNRQSHFTPKRVQLDVISSGKHIDTQKERYDEDAEVNERLKESIRKIKAGLEAVQRQQHNDRNRLSLHTSTNQNSHSGVVISSIAETAVFIISSLFQIFFVRRWFLAKAAASKAPKQWA